MMQSFVLEALKKLFDKERGEAFDEAANVLTTLLDASNIGNVQGAGNLYDMYPQYVDVKLTLSNQSDLLKQMMWYIEDHEISATLIWIIGKMHPQIAFEPVLDFGINHWNTLLEEERYQLLIAIENYILSEAFEENSNVIPKYGLFSQLLRQEYVNVSQRLQKVINRLFNYKLSDT